MKRQRKHKLIIDLPTNDDKVCITKENNMKSVTVSELIEMLKQYEDNDGGDLQVIFSSDYGDHCHTQQVHFIDGIFEDVAIEKSAYSDSGFKVLSDREEKYAGNEESKQTYLLLI
jgi:hypothetical protein